MTNPVHLVSVAALLLVAFLVGATVGTLLRLIALRMARKPGLVVEAPAEAAPATPPLVVTPVIAPLPIAPKPVAPPPAEVPVPDFAATLIALADEAPPAAFLEVVRAEPVSKQQQAPAAEGAMQAPAMQPARTAGETTSGLHIAAPQHENPVELPAERPEQRGADVIPFPGVASEPVVERPTDLVVGGEAVAVVDTSDLGEPQPKAAPVSVESTPGLVATDGAVAEDDFLIVGEEAFIVPEAELMPPAVLDATSDTVPVPVIAANAAVAAVAAADLPVPEVVTFDVVQQPALAVVDLTVPPALEATSAPTPQPAPAPAVPLLAEPQTDALPPQTTAEAGPAPQPEPQPEPGVVSPAGDVPLATAVEPGAEPQSVSETADEPIDEDAAMRAIEGNWSPRRTPVRKPRPVATPDGVNQAVAASARAVTAARRTAEAVVAEVAEVRAEVKAEAGRPAGLDQPREGRKDDLTHIIGVLPVIETALNKLGIYHFDQLGALTDENIGWIEGHLGVPGRISRELWREQARELSAVLRPKRAAEK